MWGLHCTCVLQAYLTRYGYLTDLTDPLDPRNLNKLIEALKYVRSLPFQSKTMNMANRSVYTPVCGVYKGLLTACERHRKSFAGVCLASRSFQRVNDLLPSGELDKATLEVIRRPRCGLKDPFNNKNHRYRVIGEFTECHHMHHVPHIVSTLPGRFLSAHPNICEHWGVAITVLYCIAYKENQSIISWDVSKEQTTQTLSMDFSYGGVSFVT